MANINTGAKGNTKDRPEETTTQKAQGVASDLAHKAQEAASNVAGKAQNLAGAAADRADDAISAVGERMSGLAGTIRQSGPREGVLGSATGTVADTLKSGGDYLKEHGLSDMAEDMTTLVKRYPVQSLLVGFGFGLLIGMTLSSATRR
jgi:phage-related tail protein